MTGYIVSIYRKDNWCMWSMEESCANDGEHSEYNKQCQECKLSLERVLVSFCMVFPLVV